MTKEISALELSDDEQALAAKLHKIQSCYYILAGCVEPAGYAATIESNRDTDGARRRLQFEVHSDKVTFHVGDSPRSTEGIPGLTHASAKDANGQTYELSFDPKPMIDFIDSAPVQALLAKAEAFEDAVKKPASRWSSKKAEAAVHVPGEKMAFLTQGTRHAVTDMKRVAEQLQKETTLARREGNTEHAAIATHVAGGLTQ